MLLHTKRSAEGLGAAGYILVNSPFTKARVDWGIYFTTELLIDNVNGKIMYRDLSMCIGTISKSIFFSFISYKMRMSFMLPCVFVSCVDISLNCFKFCDML
jgi:hypothetical protein